MVLLMSFGFKLPPNSEMPRQAGNVTVNKNRSWIRLLCECVSVGRWQCTVMSSPPAGEHDSDVCGLGDWRNQAPGAKVASGLTHLLKETKTLGCTGDSVWPRPTSGRYASIMRSVQIGGRSGEQETMSVASSRRMGCWKEPFPSCTSAAVLCWLKGLLSLSGLLCIVYLLLHGVTVCMCMCEVMGEGGLGFQLWKQSWCSDPFTISMYYCFVLRKTHYWQDELHQIGICVCVCVSLYVSQLTLFQHKPKQLQVWTYLFLATLPCTQCLCLLCETALQNIRKGGRVWFIKRCANMHIITKQIFGNLLSWRVTCVSAHINLKSQPSSWLYVLMGKDGCELVFKTLKICIPLKDCTGLILHARVNTACSCSCDCHPLPLRPEQLIAMCAIFHQNPSLNSILHNNHHQQIIQP